MKAFLTLASCAFYLGCTGTHQAPNNSTAPTSNTALSSQATAAPSNGSREYPRSTADAFLESCEEAGSDAAFCTCVFEKVQAKYTFEEFAVIESKLTAGMPPPDFVEFTGKARAACTK